MFSSKIVKMFYLSGLLLVPVVASASESKSMKDVKQSVRQTIYEITGKDSAVLEFTKGSSTLTESQESQVKALYSAVRDTSSVKETLILAYSDMDYPRNQKNNLPDASTTLANARGAAVKAKLDAVGAKNVNVHNMAEKANWFEKTFATKDAKIKKEETSKNSSMDEDDLFYSALGNHLNSKGGPGKVVVVIRHVDVKASH